MSAFVRPADGPVVLRLDEQETSVLGQLASQLVEMLEDATRAGIATAVHLDPAMARLVPEGYRDDPEAAEEFRRFTADDLVDGKVSAAQTVLDAVTATGPEAEVPGVVPAGHEGGVAVSLVGDTAWTWLRFLNDTRLTIAARLGIEDDTEPFEPDPTDDDDEQDPQLMMAIYAWLGYLQESIVAVLDEA
ncbi:MAG TPA: DUF2017 family protein [Plantibacter sp.]|uniref:DUF2017 family protein n=1 Tax=Plantibacter sp. TaxID=1871045 RepID=UPI002D11CCB8|nr:DUF2017 family protein [Plantibacter sp.]